MKHSILKGGKFVAKTIMPYVYSAINSLIGLVFWFRLRDLVNFLLVNSEISHWSWNAYDMFTFIAFGIAWLFMTLITQHVYSKRLSESGGWFTRSFVWVTAGEVLLFAVVEIWIMMLK